MANSADPDQMASKEANRSRSTVCKGRVYQGSAGLGLKTVHNELEQICWAIKYRSLTYIYLRN